MTICDALCDLAPIVQFKKREKHPWRSDNLYNKLYVKYKYFIC